MRPTSHEPGSTSVMPCHVLMMSCHVLIMSCHVLIMPCAPFGLQANLRIGKLQKSEDELRVMSQEALVRNHPHYPTPPHP